MWNVKCLEIRQKNIDERKIQRVKDIGIVTCYPVGVTGYWLLETILSSQSPQIYIIEIFQLIYESLVMAYHYDCSFVCIQCVGDYGQVTEVDMIRWFIQDE